MKTYKDETIELAIKRSEDLASKFVDEVKRLLKTGAVDEDNHSRGLIFGVALENIAEGFMTRDRKSKDYKNLKHF